MDEKKESSENLYDSLTKGFQSILWVIKIAVYPTTLILVIILGFGLWWGVDIRNSKLEISSAKNEIENIRKSLSLKSREIEISSKEIESDTKKRFEELADQYTRFESEFMQMNSNFQEALDQNEKLFNKLKADNRSLSDFSDTIKKTITKYTDEIEYARKGVEQRKKDIESILKKRNEQLDAVSQTMVLLTEYLVLVQAGRNRFPDPNAKREFSLINEMIYTLVPDANERNAIIKRINESTNQ